MKNIFILLINLLIISACTTLDQLSIQVDDKLPDSCSRYAILKPAPGAVSFGPYIASDFTAITVKEKTDLEKKPYSDKTKETERIEKLYTFNFSHDNGSTNWLISCKEKQYSKRTGSKMNSRLSTGSVYWNEKTDCKAENGNIRHSFSTSIETGVMTSLFWNRIPLVWEGTGRVREKNYRVLMDIGYLLKHNGDYISAIDMYHRIGWYYEKNNISSEMKIAAALISSFHWLKFHYSGKRHNKKYQ